MRGAGGGGADAAGVGALTPSMKVYVAPFIALLTVLYTVYCTVSTVYSKWRYSTVQY